MMRILTVLKLLRAKLQNAAHQRQKGEVRRRELELKVADRDYLKAALETSQTVVTGERPDH